MPTYPSRLRLEPLLQISQTLEGPPPPETQLLQSIEVYPAEVKIYFGFLYHLLIFQSLWTIEIAFRMVLHWETTGDSVTPSPSPSQYRFSLPLSHIRRHHPHQITLLTTRQMKESKRKIIPPHKFHYHPL